MNKHTCGTGPVVFVLAVILSACLHPDSHAQERAGVRSECIALDKNKPLQVISFEGIDRKAWDGNKHVKGAVLRLTNNSSCAMLLVTPQGVAPRLIKRKGKYVWQNDWDTPQLRNGSHIDVVYRLHFPPSNRSETPVGGGDVILKSKLVSGESILFSVPLKLLKQRGEGEVLFNYESNPKEESVLFSSSLVPKSLLR